MFDEKIFSYPKSLYAVLDTIKIMTNKDDIILDFFSGSGTTGHAVLELNKEDGGNRQFILVEQLDEHIKVCNKRIQKIMQKLESQKNLNTLDKKGGDFIYCELMRLNENFVEKIRELDSRFHGNDKEQGKELLNIWKTLKGKAFLSYKVDVKQFDENVAEFEQLSIEDQKKFLIECLDKSQLYVNYSEIEDEDYNISEDDKKLNRFFYERKG